MSQGECTRQQKIGQRPLMRATASVGVRLELRKLLGKWRRHTWHNLFCSSSVCRRIPRLGKKLKPKILNCELLGPIAFVTLSFVHKESEWNHNHQIQKKHKSTIANVVPVRAGGPCPACRIDRSRGCAVVTPRAGDWRGVSQRRTAAVTGLLARRERRARPDGPHWAW